MTRVSADPGGHVLWCLCRRASDVRWVLYAARAPIEAHIVQDRDVVLRESFATGAAAEWWAEEYARRLQHHGWSTSPASRSSSSAA